MNPFLKWAGGKRWLFDSEQLVFPEYHGRYIEPFVGGGAGFFRAAPAEALLSDSNARLVELYQIIRNQHAKFLTLLQQHADNHSKDYYYEVRSAVPTTKIERAAQFLYLNRTCWNGLYRENKKGNFNVPIGTKTTVIFDNDDFAGWSKVLKKADIECCDFEHTIDKSKDGDLLFIDPPYTVKHNLNGFVKYNQNIFAWEDQVRLRDAALRAHHRGTAVVITNADHESIRDLYAGFGRNTEVRRRSVISGKSSGRSATTELLITAF